MWNSVNLRTVVVKEAEKQDERKAIEAINELVEWILEKKITDENKKSYSFLLGSILPNYCLD